MKFSSDSETLGAMLVTARWLPELVRRIESGVQAMGIVIEKKGLARHTDGAVDPVLFLRGRRGWELELRLRNTLEDFFTIDRDEKPARFDPRLLDPEYAETKLGEVEAEMETRGREAMRLMLQAHMNRRGTGRVGPALRVVRPEAETVQADARTDERRIVSIFGKESAYPYPTPQGAARAKRIIALVDQLLKDEKDEKDEEGRKLLRRMREVAVQATQAYPAPPVAGERSASGLPPDRIIQVRETLRRVAKAFGVDDIESASIPDLGREVNELKKRIDVLAGIVPEVDGRGMFWFKATDES